MFYLSTTTNLNTAINHKCDEISNEEIIISEHS